MGEWGVEKVGGEEKLGKKSRRKRERENECEKEREIK